MNLILIPVYNDWKSLNKLLEKINGLISKNSTRVLIIDDFSSVRMKLNIIKLKKLKKIEVLRLHENVGSQKAIAKGLDHLKKRNKRNFDYITIMDGDGEDDPKNLASMLAKAKKNENSVVVSCRINRNKNLLFRIGYKLHLILTFIFTLNWMSFGNFSCFSNKNLKKILSDDSIWYAYSAAIKKNTNISKVFALRAKRYYGNSRVNLIFLINHSLNIISIFYKRVFFLSIIYLSLINFYFDHNVFLINILVIFFNILIIFIKFKNDLKKETFYTLKKIK
tara:strand:- start:1161 stop:1997 length:837 start_codon:yes stop_codon:yes gene_type:complete